MNFKQKFLTISALVLTAITFNVNAQIVGRVNASEEKKLTIKSEFGTFVY